jgi:hypothetical protein
MRAFTRYCLHFGIIVSFLAIILFFLGKPHLSIKQMVICYLIAIVGYALPMAVFYSSQAKPITKVLSGNPAEICAHLDSDLLLKGNRTCVNDDGIKKIYAYTIKETSPFASMAPITRYFRWLTDDVTITVDNSDVVITGPQAIVSKLGN